MSKRLSRPSPALVVAVIALIVALGGTANGALQDRGGAEASGGNWTQVNGAQLATNSVRSRALAPRSVAGRHLKRDVIGTRHVRSGSLGADEIADGSLTADELGLQIASGDPQIIGPGAVGTVRVTCPGGMQVLGPYAINWSGSKLPDRSIQSIAIGENELVADGYNGAGDAQAFFASAVCIPGGAIPND